MGDPVIRLILVRHGVTEWNEQSRYQGQQDVPLGDLGRRQAERLGLRLRDEPIALAYTSDLRRARETAEVALGGRPIAVTESSALRELCFGAWEGLRHDEVAARFPADWEAWTRAPASTCPPGGGESLARLRERVVGFYRSAIGALRDSRASAVGQHPRDWFTHRAAGEEPDPKSQRTLLLVSHGGPVRALLTYFFEMPVELYWRFGVGPASLTILDVYPKGPVTEVIGDTSHLAGLQPTGRL